MSILSETVESNVLVFADRWSLGYGYMGSISLNWNNNVHPLNWLVRSINEQPGIENRIMSACALYQYENCEFNTEEILFVNRLVDDLRNIIQCHTNDGVNIRFERNNALTRQEVQPTFSIIIGYETYTIKYKWVCQTCELLPKRICNIYPKIHRMQRVQVLKMRLT